MKRQGHVLVVDDDALIREVFRLLLCRHGHEVQTAESGEEALALMRTRAFDVVITDNRMPGISGVELAMVIGIRYPSQPVVMISSCPPEEPVSGLRLVLRKPEGISQIVSAVENLVANPHTILAGRTSP